MIEFELKFQVPEAALRALTLEMRARGARTIRLAAQYVDTPDALLGTHRFALRLRREGRRWVQTLKAAGDASALQRLEHNVPVRVAAGGEPSIDLARHDGTPVGAALRALLARHGHPVLAERCATDVQRRFVDLHPLDAVVEAALDIGQVRAGERSAPICELELEHKGGDARGLFALARLWSAHGGLWLDVRPKSARGEWLARGAAHGPAVKVRAPVLDGTMNGGQLQRAVLHAALDAVLANASEVAAGSPEPEHLHQLRIALRRLRTALRELGGLAPGIDPAWEPVLAETFGLLGRLRDEQAVLAAVRPLLHAAGAPRLEWTPAPAIQGADAVVRESAFQSTLLALLEHVICGAPAHSASTTTTASSVTPPTQASLSPPQSLAWIRSRLSALHRQVAKDGKRFDTLPAEAQHRTRKRLKRLRYLAEAVAPLFANGKAAKRYLQQLGPAQDALGQHNDLLIGAARFLADADREPRAYWSAGFLHGRLGASAMQAHKALRRLAKTRPFWTA